VRLRLPSGETALVCYSANVHPGERLADVWAALEAATAVRTALGLERMGLGLWLARSALAELATSGGAARLRDQLAACGLEVTTMNGFPYGNFHAEVVKRAVYHPDWCTHERQVHSTALAELLAEVLPADAEGGTISTLPLAHRNEVSGDPAAFIARACVALCRTATQLGRLADKTGKQVRLCLEPEPGCLIESSDDAIRWWTEWLPEAARRTGVAGELLSTHLGLCFDSCHQALQFEDAPSSLAALERAGVPIGKVQLSSALVVSEPGSPAGRAALARFAEPRFLHQVRLVGDDGRVYGLDDLYPDLEGTSELPADRPWRIHFHVPIHREVVGEVGTTRDFLTSALGYLTRPDRPVGSPLPQLEVETYTWSALPESERPRGPAELAQGIAAELSWAAQELGAGA
jgi:sugar phosphate isomerase/epimerase